MSANQTEYEKSSKRTFTADEMFVMVKMKKTFSDFDHESFGLFCKIARFFWVNAISFIVLYYTPF